jgi:DNA-3-methyladenine glycosylase I
MSYCKYCREQDEASVHRVYHDTQYGFTLADDNELFGRLILEINQAGLSWDTILKKQNAFREAFDNYEIAVIAQYENKKFEELMQNKGIVRNRLKVKAVIHNANEILIIQQQYGSFKLWLDAHKGKSLDEWVRLFKKNFKFVGGEIINEFLKSTAYLPGAHDKDCKIIVK